VHSPDADGVSLAMPVDEEDSAKTLGVVEMLAISVSLSRGTPTMSVAGPNRRMGQS
jgi:hypothetical protein